MVLHPSLFNTMSSSSSPVSALRCCGLEPGAAVTTQLIPFHVHNATPTIETFSWSDFPIIVHQEEDDYFAVRLPATKAPTAADFSSSSWSPPTSITSYSLRNDEASESRDKTYSHQFCCSTSKKKKNVRFAPSLEIRTHSLVLGDHPWCEDGLAIDLGWEYEDAFLQDDYTVVDFQSHKDCKQQQQKKQQEQQLIFTRRSSISTRLCHNRGSSRRRSYLERKRLLLEVGGYSNEELEYTIVFEEKEGQEKHDDIYRQHQRSQTRILRVGSINKSISLFSIAE